MPEFLKSTPTPPVNSDRHWRRRFASLGFMAAIILALLFGYRVFGYYRKIQTGVLDPTTYSFQSTPARQSDLVAIAQAAPGSGQLATADDPALGPAKAKLTIVEFADFGCPYSEQESYVVDAITKQYPENVKIIYRDFPLPDLHPGADLAAQAAACADAQGKFWDYHDILFRNSGEFTPDALLDYASQANLNTNQFATCFNSGQYADEVAQDLADGVAAGVSGTPTFFMNGEKVEGAIPFTDFKNIVDAFLTE